MPVELNDDGTVKEPVKIELTPEQQEHVNKLINERFAKITSKHEQEVARIKAEHETAKAEAIRLAAEEAAKGGKKEDNKDDAQTEQFKQLLEAEKAKTKAAELRAATLADETKASKSEVLTVKKQQAMINAASKYNFYELGTALKLTEDSIAYDDETKSFVVKENGIIKQNSSLQNMTLEDYYAGFAAERPYLVNGSVKSGAGSSESKIFGNNGLVKAKADLKSAKEKSDYITKFGLDKYAELPNK